jgi:outer membrane protein OmpA-like peptidoglycan-associated protein
MGAVIVALFGALMVLLSSSGERLGNERVVVLRSADGHVGAVVVERGGERVVLNEAYASSDIVAGGAPERRVLTAAEVRSEFAAVLLALPEPPKTFLVYFNEGTDELTPESRVEFQKILAEIRGRTGPDILVIGHTDRLASDDYNDRLSLQRAQRVRDELIQLGIPPDHIRAAGRGEREPLVPTGDGVAEPSNRRVEINVR